MEIKQIAVIIPDDIAFGIARGWYTRSGNVVRWATGPMKGQIVKMLKTVDLPDFTPKAHSMRVLLSDMKTFVVKHKITSAIGATVVGSVGIYSSYHAWKTHSFHKAFDGFLNAIENGTMTIDLINNLDTNLHKFRSIKLTYEEFSRIFDFIRKYTLSLAEVNGYHLTDSENNIVDIHSCLDIQRKVLKAA